MIFLNLNIDFEIVEVQHYGLLNALNKRQLVSQHLSANVVAESFDSLVCRGRMLQSDADAVCDLEAALLAQVLNALDKFACNTFVAQLVGHGDVQGYGQCALIGYCPTRNIL